jgi:putative SOS response-associated peptidase YedK
MAHARRKVFLAVPANHDSSAARHWGKMHSFNHPPWNRASRYPRADAGRAAQPWPPGAEGRGTDPDKRIAFAILTDEPNELVADYHDRMPLALADDKINAWLGLSNLDPLHDDLLLDLRTFTVRPMDRGHEQCAPEGAGGD